MTAYPFVRAALARLNIYRRMTVLEDRMDQTAIALAELNDATNEVAAELEDALGKLSQADESTAAQIRAAATRLRGLAVDPEQPVPAPSDPATSESTSGDEQLDNPQS